MLVYWISVWHLNGSAITLRHLGVTASRITAFGQSAGSVSIAYQAYAYPNDPIVAGYIMESGTPHSWTPLTPALGCATLVQCFFNSWMWDIRECFELHAVEEHVICACSLCKSASRSTAALNQPQFQPVEDNITVFHDYSALAAAGKFANW
jgi:carboxylesterase type B